MWEKLRQKFKRKEKEEEKTPWGEPIEKKRIEDPNSFKNYVKSKLGFFSRLSSKYKTAQMRSKSNSRLLKLRRIIAGFLALIYLMSFIVSLPGYVSIMFFLTFYIMLDYLWRTRIFSWFQGE